MRIKWIVATFSLMASSVFAQLDRAGNALYDDGPAPGSITIWTFLFIGLFYYGLYWVGTNFKKIPQPVLGLMGFLAFYFFIASLLRGCK